MKPTGTPTEKIMELYNQGLSIASICDITDETPTVIEQTIFHELEKQERKAAKRAARNAPILQVFSETNNVAETAKACNISKQLVYKVLKKNNIEPPRVHPAKATRKKEIAKYYGIDEEDLSVFLPIMANYRNLCAHEDILYDHKTQRGIPNNKYHHMLNIPIVEGEYIYGKNDLYSLVIMFKYMLSPDDFRLLIYELGYEIDVLDGKVDSIPINKILDNIGFPTNWRDIAEV